MCRFDANWGSCYFILGARFSNKTQHFLYLSGASDASLTETPRRRHRQQQAVSMMLMGIVMFIMVFVPMGFQFLAALGGKAFLMAKLALLLASVNGLKRVRNCWQTSDLFRLIPPMKLLVFTGGIKRRSLRVTKGLFVSYDTEHNTVWDSASIRIKIVEKHQIFLKAPEGAQRRLQRLTSLTNVLHNKFPHAQFRHDSLMSGETFSHFRLYQTQPEPGLPQYPYGFERFDRPR